LAAGVVPLLLRGSVMILEWPHTNDIKYGQ
jgi:hypothetical protein